MPTVTVTIKSPSRDARLEWDAHQQTLSSAAGVYTASFQATSGDHDYQIFVWGAPGEAWSATLTGGATNNQHAGHMSSSNGSDCTPDVPYTV